MFRHFLAMSLLAFVFSTSLSGCGQKGPLVLPQEETSTNNNLQRQQ